MCARKGATVTRTTVVVAAVCLVAAGCTSSKPATTSHEGGLLRIGTTAPIDSLNPFVARGRPLPA